MSAPAERPAVSGLRWFVAAVGVGLVGALVAWACAGALGVVRGGYAVF